MPSRLHIFAISLLPISNTEKLFILSARLGAILPATSVAKAHRPLSIVLASLHPPGNTIHRNVRIFVNAPGWFSREIRVNRIRSGDEAQLRIDVEPIEGFVPQTLRFQIDEEGAPSLSFDVAVEIGTSEHNLPQWVSRSLVHSNFCTNAQYLTWASVII